MRTQGAQGGQGGQDSAILEKKNLLMIMISPLQQSVALVLDFSAVQLHRYWISQQYTWFSTRISQQCARTVLGFLGSVLDIVLGFLSDELGIVLRFLSSVLNTIPRFLNSVLHTVLGFLGNMLNIVMGFFSSILDKVLEFLGGKFCVVLSARLGTGLGRVI